jgi:hypothetical protein
VDGGKIFMQMSVFDGNGTCNKMKAALMYKDDHDFPGLTALQDLGYFLTTMKNCSGSQVCAAHRCQRIGIDYDR